MLSTIVEAFDLDLPPLPKFVALVLADNANYMGMSWPGIDTISRKTSISRRGVQRWLRYLETRGVISRIRDAGTNRPITYRLNFASIPKAPKHDPIHSCPKDLRRLVIAAFHEVCQYCGVAGNDGYGPDGEIWNIDRIEPGARGGKYEPANVTLACRACNLRKRTNEVETRPKCLSDVSGAIRGTRFEKMLGAIFDKSGCQTRQITVPQVASYPSSNLHLTEEAQKARESIRRKIAAMPNVLRKP